MNVWGAISRGIHENFETYTPIFGLEFNSEKFAA